MLDKSLVILHITRFDFTVKPILKVIMENFMARTKLKSLAATTAITLAAIGTPAFAEEVTPTVDANTDTVVSTTEVPEAEAPKTSADVKQALDAQQAVVNDLGNEALTAMDADAAAQRDLSSAQAQVDAATQAVKDAEANAAAATPENIAANLATLQTKQLTLLKQMKLTLKSQHKLKLLLMLKQLLILPKQKKTQPMLT